MSKFDGPFWELVTTEHERASAYCIRLAGDRDEGKDLYQDSLMTAFKAFTQLRNIDSFRPWFYTIINNAFRGRARSPWWKRVFSGIDDLSAVGGSTNPTGLYDARRRLDYAMTALGADDKIIVTLAELEGWKLAEIANMLSMTEAQVKMRLSRAREKMRRQLSRLLQPKSETRRASESEVI